MATKRVQADAAPTRADAVRQHLGAALARAVVDLAEAVVKANKADADPAESGANIDRARARCREARAALALWDRSESMRKSQKQIGAPIRQFAEKPTPIASASPPPAPPGEHAARGQSDGPRDESGQRRQIRRFAFHFPGQKHGRNGARATPSLLRQTIDLSVLILAYLAYFHVDVRLQIMTLPSLF